MKKGRKNTLKIPVEIHTAYSATEFDCAAYNSSILIHFEPIL